MAYFIKVFIYSSHSFVFFFLKLFLLKLCKIQTFKPVIIDYDRTHVVVNGKSYYSIIPFYPSKLTDIIFLVFKTLDCIFSSETPIMFNNKILSIDEKQKKLYLRNKQKFLDHARNILKFFVNDEDDELWGTYYIDEYTKTTVHLVDIPLDSEIEYYHH